MQRDEKPEPIQRNKADRSALVARDLLSAPRALVLVFTAAYYLDLPADPDPAATAPRVATGMGIGSDPLHIFLGRAFISGERHHTHSVEPLRVNARTTRPVTH